MGQRRNGRLDAQAQNQYNGNEVNENAVKRGEINQGQGADAGQLSSASGRNEGRGDNVYAGQGAGRETNRRGAQSNAGNLRQDDGGVHAELLSQESRDNLTKQGVTDLHLREESDGQRLHPQMSAIVFLSNQG